MDTFLVKLSDFMDYLFPQGIFEEVLRHCGGGIVDLPVIIQYQLSGERSTYLLAETAGGLIGGKGQSYSTVVAVGSYAIEPVSLCKLISRELTLEIRVS